MPSVAIEVVCGYDVYVGTGAVCAYAPWCWITGGFCGNAGGGGNGGGGTDMATGGTVCTTGFGW